MSKNASPTALLRARRRIPERLPPFEELVRGSLLERRVRCGKPSCHCADDAGHHVAYLSVTFRGGRTEQITVPRALIPTIRRWVRNYQRWWEAIEAVSAVNRQLLRIRQVPAATSRVPPTRRERRRQNARQDSGS